MRIKFILIILLQVLLLTGMIVYKQNWVARGEKILLRTVPVDPRDIFRGDYVRLTYEISRLDLDKLAVKERFKRNEKIYVSLVRNEDGTYSASSVSKTIPSDEKFIQGRVIYQKAMNTRWEVLVKDDSGEIWTFEPRWLSGIKKGDRVTFCLDRLDNVRYHFKVDSRSRRKCTTDKTVTGIIKDIKTTKFTELNVAYGIESYFVEEGRGRVIETARNARKVTVEVSLRKSGKGIISALLMDGKVVSR